MDGGWTDIGGGAIVAILLFNGGGHQVGRGVGLPIATPNGTLGRWGDPKNP